MKITKSNRSRNKAMAPSRLERDEMLMNLLEKLVDKNLEGAVFIVEGKKDAEALRQIGISGKIFRLKAGRTPFYDLLSKFLEIEEEVIILTDFDRRGTQLVGRIASYLEPRGKTPNIRFWMRMKSLLSNDIKDIESVITYLEKINKNKAKIF